MNNYAFLLVCEGINYQSEIRINNIFIAKNRFGFGRITSLIEENILRTNNSIVINIDNSYNYESTIPPKRQINYAKNLGGIFNDIYIVAVPKIYVYNIRYSVIYNKDKSVTLPVKIFINSENVSSYISNFNNNKISLKLKLSDPTGENNLFDSPPINFELSNYQNDTIESTILLRDIRFWKTEQPVLYNLKVILYNNEKIIDEFNVNVGFNKISYSDNGIYFDNSPIELKGINYFESNLNKGLCKNYSETLNSLLKIKELGFNALRSPGRPFSPYVVEISEKIGLYLIEEIPFNEITDKQLSDKRFIDYSLDYLQNIIDRDFNSPSILLWGIGNNFDVTNENSLEYVKKAKSLINNINTNKRIFFTTKTLKNNICIEESDFIGLDFTGTKLESVINTISSIDNKKFFIASFGPKINNDNYNGYSDIFSNEYQAYFFSEVTKIIKTKPASFFFSSYSDYVTELNIISNIDNKFNNINTSGIFTVDYQSKYSANIIKRILNGQGHSRIQQGSSNLIPGNEDSFFKILGIFLLFLLLILIGKLKYFKENLLSSFFTPRKFINIIQDNSISSFQNFVIAFFISSAVAINITALLFIFRFNLNYELIFSRIFSDEYSKTLIIYLLKSPILSYIIFTFILFFIISLLALFFRMVFLNSPRNSNYTSTFTIVIWSFTPFLITLIIGSFFINFIESHLLTFLYFSTFLYLYCIIKFLFTIYSVHNPLSLKKFIYSFGFILLIHSGMFYLIFIQNSLLQYISLIKTFEF